LSHSLYTSYICRHNPARMTQKQPVQATSSPATPTSDYKWPIRFLLAAAVVVVYATSVSNGFVFFDDDKAILYNSALKNPSLGKFFTGQNLGMYAPFTWIAYWVGSLLSGQEAWGYHLLGMLLHALNAVLVHMILRRLLGAERGRLALFAALLFAVHPIQVEAVSWAAALSTVLFASGYLGAWYAFVRYAQSGGAKWWIGSMVLFAAACLSKSAAVTLPMVLVATSWLFFSGSLRQLLRATLPYFGLALVFGAYTFVTREAEGHNIEATSAAFSVADRFFMVCQTILFYPFKLLVPAGFSIAYPFVKLGGSWHWTYYVAPVVLLAASVFVALKCRKQPITLFALAVYLLPLTVMLPFRTVGSFELRSDRYAYVSCIGVFLLVGLLLERLPKPARLGALGVTALVLAGLAWQQTSVWKEGVVLFKNCTAKTPESSLCQCNLAYNQLINNDFAGAITHYSEALKYDPNTIEAYNGRGQAYLFSNKIPEALADFTAAIQSGISTPKLYLNRAKCLVQLNRPAEALPDLRKSLDLEPNSPEAYLYKGMAHERTGQTAEAERDYTTSIQQNPKAAEPRINRGVLYFQQGKYAEAEADFTAALESRPPQMPQLLNNRANARFKLGRLTEALADANAALAANPNYTRARDTKAMLEAAMKK
jgi:protein O-mannosyl-transferase